VKPADAFEVTAGGTRDVSWKVEAGKVELAPGEVRISSFIIVTADAGLRARLQERYQKSFAANVARIREGGG